ncbi:hypothetical protein [Flavobacterium aquiphilum]|uniref:hypothetical protein n=1 Tax=Flavobacterium aquiphilum TaxID=3003261 RepID=UPI00248029E2|nr:hypothetical protein [Flavobacterium aquiphilum]
MKKLLLILIFFLVSYEIHAQEILFKVAYKPNLIYKQSMESTSKNTVTYLGPNELLKRLEEKKLENPKYTLSKNYIESTNSTGNFKNGQFPLTIKFEGDDKSIIPGGTTIYGHVITDKTPVLDSINAPKLDSLYRIDFLSTMQKVISQISLPEQKIKSGESFVREIPTNIPIGKFNFNLTNTITYTLKKIKNKKAYFDITQVYAINSKNTDLSLKASGEGKGQIIYDIENTFYLLYELNSTINMLVSNEEMNFKVVTESITKQSTNISK